MPPCTPEKTKPSSASSSISISKPHRPRDIDPLLKDLSEKKHSFRRNVVSMVSEMKEFRTRLSLQEQSFAKETLTRQEAESKASSLQEEISRLQKSLEEKNEQLQASTSDTEKYLSELDGLRTQLTSTQSAADASAASAESAHFQCTSLRIKLDSKNNSLTEQEQRLKRMEEQLDNLQNNLQVREVSQNHLKEEMLRVERDIVQAIADQSVTAEDRNCEIRKLLDEVSSKNLKKMNELLSVKDEEIARLKGEIETLSAHWRFKARELEAQLDKHQKADQDLKRRILKLEFCLQEARSQTRKLQRMGER